MAESARFPNSLAYVREQRKLSADAVAKAIKTSEAQLAKFESGEALPTKLQFAALEGIYGVADFLLAADTRPNIDPLLYDLRKGSRVSASLSPAGLKSYFIARDFAELVSGLAATVGESPVLRRPQGIHVSGLFDYVESAQKLLKFNPKVLSEDADYALRYLRYRVEQFGITCLLLNAPQQDFRGLYSELDNPLILINKKTFSPKARLFSLAHELGHYLLGITGISDPFVIENDIELQCNKFASEFLAPTNWFEELLARSRSHSTDFSSTVSRISRWCLLSKGAIAYRLMQDGHVAISEYRRWYVANRLSQEYGAEDPPDDVSSDDQGGDYQYNVVSEKGYRPILLVKQAVEKGYIDQVDASRILNARGVLYSKVLALVDGRIEKFEG